MPWSLEPKCQNSDSCEQDSTLNNQGERKYDNFWFLVSLCYTRAPACSLSQMNLGAQGGTVCTVVNIWNTSVTLSSLLWQESLVHSHSTLFNQSMNVGVLYFFFLLIYTLFKCFFEMLYLFKACLTMCFVRTLMETTSQNLSVKWSGSLYYKCCWSFLTHSGL